MQVSKASGIHEKILGLSPPFLGPVCSSYSCPGLSGQRRVRQEAVWAAVKTCRCAHRAARALGRELGAPAEPPSRQETGWLRGRPQLPATTSPTPCSASARPQCPSSCRPYLGRQPGRERGAQAPSASRWPPVLGGRPCHRPAAASGAPGPGPERDRGREGGAPAAP